MTQLDMSVKTTCSVPGKTLITGGYLVLDREYRGIVIGLDARFYCDITEIRPSDTSARDGMVVEVISPQFSDASRKYRMYMDCGRCELAR